MFAIFQTDLCKGFTRFDSLCELYSCCNNLLVTSWDE